MTMTEKPVQRRYVLDAGALIAHERNNPKVGALLKVAARQRIEMVLPSVVLAQVWRDGSRQAVLSRMLRTPGLVEARLHHEDAKRVGELLRESGTTDVADAHVVVLAGRLRASVITSDPDDISKLNAELPLIRV
jgi:ABC-type molybdenum transport system ATPase subunit/photorepair protein PhrA